MEIRQQVHFTLEALHQLLDLPDDAIIRDITITDPSHGVATCFFVSKTEDPNLATLEGQPSVNFVKPDHLIHSVSSNFLPKELRSDDSL